MTTKRPDMLDHATNAVLSVILGLTGFAVGLAVFMLSCLPWVEGCGTPDYTFALLGWLLASAVYWAYLTYGSRKEVVS